MFLRIDRVLDSKVLYFHFVTKSRQARRCIPWNSCWHLKGLIFEVEDD